MIDPREFRLGNKFLFRGIEFDVTELPLSIVMSTHPEDVQPISLTPSWLERLGFERTIHKVERWDYSIKDDTNGLKSISRYHELVTRFGTIKVQYSRVTFNDERIEVNYVHQLQNLYFSLTGEELTIKP